MSDELNTTDLIVEKTKEEAQDSLPEAEPKEEEEEIKQKVMVEPLTLSLPTGNKLTLGEIYPVSALEPSIFVVLAGGSECGKTTLITSVYQQFLKNIPQRYYFAGSQTIQAFEKRAFLSRTCSNRTNPEMQRTQRGSLDSFLHIRIWDSLLKPYTNLLLADFSGEDYNNVSANTKLAEEDFNMVNIADFLIILLDGKNIANNLKHKEVQKAAHILRTFYDANLLHSKIRIIIAISKYDLVYKQYKINPDKKDFEEKILKKISTQVPAISSRIKFMRIAAMPDDINDIQIGYGLTELLNELLKMHESKNNVSLPILKHKSISEFNLFQERVLE